VAWISGARRRRTKADTSWKAKLVDAYAKGAALHDAMAAAETPGALADDTATLRWSDIQRRADDYSQLLYGMQQIAPSDQERLTIAEVLASLQAVQSAMAAERAGGPPDTSVSGLVRERLSAFGAAVGALRHPKSDPRDPQPA
jgi:hypothetical protein